MDNAIGENKRKRSKMLDLLLLLGTGVLVVVLGTTAFLIADKYHVNPAWLFAVGSGALFLAVVGWGYRRKFRSPGFVTFFLAWLFLHVAIYLIVLAYLGFFYYVPIVVFELWIGYTLVIWQFGPPPDQGLR